MKKIKFFTISFLWMVVASFWLSGCQTTSQTNATTAEDAATAAGNGSQAPKRVDIRGFITQREYNQGQMLILVEGNIDPFSRFNRAIVLVTPFTQIIGVDGKSISLSELNNGQRVAIQFRGRYRESITGFSAQATARKMWIEPLTAD